MILDATAGNRQFWGYDKRGRDHTRVVFVDRELTLWNPPTVFADFRYLPFRNNVFEVAIFDPPYYVDRRAKVGGGSRVKNFTWMFWNPDGSKKRFKRSSPIAHFGAYNNRREMRVNLIKGARELYRVAYRLCFQWGESDFLLDQIFCLFSPPWVKVWWMNRRSRGHKRQRDLWWVTFIRNKELID